MVCQHYSNIEKFLKKDRRPGVDLSLARCGVSKSKLVNAEAPCPAFGALKV
jgi:hypothetical protein